MAFIDELKNGLTEKEKADFHFSGRHFGGAREDWLGNIFNAKMNQEHRKMFGQGSGNELRSKAHAVHSSSMLAYNFFHWISTKNPICIDGVRYTMVFFEVRIPCIKQSKTNMDVVLSTDDFSSVLFIESKFTEHYGVACSDMKNMSTSYDDPRNYYATTMNWPKIIKEYRELSQNNAGFYNGIKQEICHMIALEALHGSKHARGLFAKMNSPFRVTNETKMSFKSVLFEPKNDLERSAHKNYCELLKQFHGAIHDFVPFSVAQITYSDLWKSASCNMPGDVKAFLKRRYMDFAFL